MLDGGREGSRRAGLGRTVVSAVCEDALREGLLPQYATFESNEGSLRLARSLGFERALQFMTGMANIRDVIPFPRVPGSAAF